MATGGTVGTRGEFREELVRHGIVIASGSAGGCGYSAEFEDTVERVDRLVARRGAGDRQRSCVSRRSSTAVPRAERLPRVVPSPGRFDSHFTGDERAHRQLIQS